LKKIRRHPTHTELNSLLDEIEAGLPIKAEHFKNLLTKNKINLNDFAYFYGHSLSTLSDGGKKPNSIDEWYHWRQAVVGHKVNLTSKVTAASTGHSHSVSNQHSMLACWPANEKHPSLASFDGHRWHIPFNPSTDLLILENEALFLMRNEMKMAIKELLPSLLGSMDWVFSSGNSIAKKSNKEFLTQYKNIHIFTDIDLGGLKIYSNLVTLMGESTSELTHVIPKNLTAQLKKYGTSFGTEYRNKIMKMTPTLNGNSLIAARAIINTGLTMEQEALLRNNNE
jgi:hypothetical protein